MRISSGGSQAACHSDSGGPNPSASVLLPTIFVRFWKDRLLFSDLRDAPLPIAKPPDDGKDLRLVLCPRAHESVLALTVGRSRLRWLSTPYFLRSTRCGTAPHSTRQRGSRRPSQREAASVLCGAKLADWPSGCHSVVGACATPSGDHAPRSDGPLVKAATRRPSNARLAPIRCASLLKQ